MIGLIKIIYSFSVHSLQLISDKLTVQRLSFTVYAGTALSCVNFLEQSVSKSGTICVRAAARESSKL